jgi:hypothetical protein
MNASVDPCTDFYEFACGNWIKKHPIPDDAPSVSNFENLGQDLEFALKGTRLPLVEHLLSILDHLSISCHHPQCSVFSFNCLSSVSILQFIT